MDNSGDGVVVSDDEIVGASNTYNSSGQHLNQSRKLLSLQRLTIAVWTG